jgi:hypothetical protein
MGNFLENNVKIRKLFVRVSMAFRNNRPEINFMQKNSPVFPLFQKGIDAKMKGI